MLGRAVIVFDSVKHPLTRVILSCNSRRALEELSRNASAVLARRSNVSRWRSSFWGYDIGFQYGVVQDRVEGSSGNGSSDNDIAVAKITKA